MQNLKKRLISDASPKNAEKARRRLDGTNITINLMARPSQRMTCGEALIYGNQLLTEGEAHAALSVADQLLEAQDEIIDIYLLKARSLIDLEAIYELDILIGELLSVAPDNIGVLAAASRFYLLLGRVKDSFLALKKINDLRPGRFETFSQMALCYRYSGASERAIKMLERCITQVWKKRFTNEEKSAQYRSVLFRYAGFRLVDDEMRDDLEYFAQSTDDKIAASASYALSQQSAFNKNVEDEQRFLIEANKHENRSMTKGLSLKVYLQGYEKNRAMQMDLFQSSTPDWLEGINKGSHSPIFILGLPRSGTTLMEQILGAHSLIGQTGESKGFSLAVENAFLSYRPVYSGGAFPEHLKQLPKEAYEDIFRYYERHQAVMTDSTMYIDKELYNFNFLGLMAILFPNAKFIHMNRAPLDIFLSCFKNSIPGVHATSDLQHLAEYYVHMKRLIGYWRSIFEDRVFIMNYRDLVEEPIKYTERVVEYLGVDLEESMLNFHERKNVVRTLSVDQVRQKIYTTSVEKWRKYESMLEPAKDRLEELGIPLGGVSYIDPEKGNVI